jgi:hypothetical protein
MDPRHQALTDLGITRDDIHALRTLPFEVAVKRLEELKERVRKNFKALALALHPDRTGGDPVKTERFKVISSIKDEFEKLQLQPPRPVQQAPVMVVPVMPVPMRVVTVVSWTRAGSPYTSTQTSTTVNGILFNIATMRPT